MQYDFDRVIDRHGTHSLKWDYCQRYDGVEVLPLWVADMDFQAPPEVIDAIMKRAQHGIFGYTPLYESYYHAVMQWMERRHTWKIEKEWILASPGVVSAAALAIMAYTQPGDEIIIQPPVYHPFARIIHDNGRRVKENRLQVTNGRYEMDYEKLEAVMHDRTKMIILCSPHNPVGRVWTRDELETMAALCIKHSVLMISDEIHCDLLMTGHTHTPLATISEEIAHNTVTFTAASKSFNLAGLACSNVIVPNKKLRAAFRAASTNIAIGTPNLFGLIATEAAYRCGEPWFDQLLEYVANNYFYLVAYCQEHLPQVTVWPLEGTYLAWMDFRNTGASNTKIDELMLQGAKVWLDSGAKFGAGGEGFQRINLACPRQILHEGLQRIKNALES